MSGLGGGVVGNDFDIMAYAASGMEAQRGALDVAARNMALAQTATPGHPVYGYQPVYSVDPNALADNPFAALVHSARDTDETSNDTDDESDDDSDDSEQGAWSVAGAGGGSQGLVAMTGVRQSSTEINPITQMLDVINAQRAYEANASVLDVGKTLAAKTISIEQ